MFRRPECPNTAEERFFRRKTPEHVPAATYEFDETPAADRAHNRNKNIAVCPRDWSPPVPAQLQEWPLFLNRREFRPCAVHNAKASCPAGRGPAEASGASRPTTRSQTSRAAWRRIPPPSLHRDERSLTYRYGCRSG